jgi:DNA-binding CsgD family transcriptional regulator
VTSNFKTTKWKLAADIKVSGEKMGMVEVYYLKQRPIVDEGPFLKEERLLIDGIAERIGRAAERIQAQKQLQVEQVALKNMNIALREVLARVQDEKKEIGDAVQANVDKIIMPLLHALEPKVTPEHQQYLVLLKRNLEEIVSPFTNKLSKEFMILTPVEVQICNMIKNGLSTKEIAKLRGISPATVSRHREHIRKKLGITKKEVNLATYLSALMAE